MLWTAPKVDPASCGMDNTYVHADEDAEEVRRAALS